MQVEVDLKEVEDRQVVTQTWEGCGRGRVAERWLMGTGVQLDKRNDILCRVAQQGNHGGADTVLSTQD